MHSFYSIRLNCAVRWGNLLQYLFVKTMTFYSVCVCPSKPYGDVPIKMAVSKILCLVGNFFGPHEENGLSHGLLGFFLCKNAENAPFVQYENHCLWKSS